LLGVGRGKDGLAFIVEKRVNRLCIIGLAGAEDFDFVANGKFIALFREV